MSLSAQLASTTRWRQTLLEAPLPPDLATVLPEFLKQVAHEFIPSVSLDFSADEHATLDRWYASSAGQQALALFTSRLWRQMGELAQFAMPAHDARHAMYKVPARALEYMSAEQVQGWQRIGVLGGLLHDHGRWAEERIFGEPGESLIHARLSYLLGKELLEDIDMPTSIKQHILLSAIRHTSGAGPEDPMPLKLTVTADRDQLYGPEIILRIAHHPVSATGDSASFYGEKGAGLPILGSYTKYLRNRLPGPLFSLQPHVDSLWESLAYFVLMCDTYEEAVVRFEPVLASPRGVPAALQPFNLAKEWAVAQELRPVAADPTAALRQMLSAQHAAPSTAHFQEALDKLSELPTHKSAALAGALTFANEQRWSEDLRQREALRQIAKANEGDLLVTTLTGLLLASWTE